MTFLKIFIVIVVFVVIAVHEVRELVKKQLNRELWVFSFLLLIGFLLTVSYLLGFKVKLPPLPG